MALTERRITIRLHYIYNSPCAKADRAWLGHWFIYLLWGCTTQFTLGTSVIWDAFHMGGTAKDAALHHQGYLSHILHQSNLKQRSNNTLGFQKRETECVLTEDKTILRIKTAQWPYIWEHKLVTKVEKINYFVTRKSKTHGELKRGDQTITFVWEHTQQFEQKNSRFSSQPADSLQCVMSLHYTDAHTSYRPFDHHFPP